jgi:hypothetical protein
MLTVEIRQEEIPTAFRRFCEIVGDRTWLDRADYIDAEIKRNPLLIDYLPKQNSLVLAFSKCSHAAAHNGNRLPWELTGDPLMFEAHIFSVQTLALIDAATKFSKKRANSLISRVRDAFQYPTAIQALQLEARVATHFVRVGHSVYFPELGSGKERFDILNESLGPAGLEIECKAVTQDKGRKIHRGDAFEFFHLALPVIQTVACGLTAGLAVVVTVPGRLQQPEEFEALVNAMTQQILVGESGTLQDGTHVRIIDFRPEDLGDLKRPPSTQNRAAVARITGTDNRESIIYQAERCCGVVILVLQSAQPDSMLHEVFATLAESSGRQLTGKRAGAFIGGFEGLGHKALLDTAINEGRGGTFSALAWEASRFLEQPEFPHVVGIGFLSATDNSELPDADNPKGITYYFPKQTSPFWHPDYAGMFGSKPNARTAIAMPRDSLLPIRKT